MASLFSVDISKLKGVGEKRAKFFKRLNVSTVGDLLQFYPRDYEDWSIISSISQTQADSVCVVKGTVLHTPTAQRIPGGSVIYKTIITDNTANIELTYFNNPYIPKMLCENQTYLFRGKISVFYSKRTMAAPDFVSVSKAVPLVPIYPQTKGLSSRMISSAVQNALALLPDIMHDPLPDSLRRKHHLCHLRFAMENIHFPTSFENMEIARKRLIFEELLILQLGLLTIKKHEKLTNNLALIKDCTNDFYKLLPFTLTSAQKKAIQESMNDLKKDVPMNRLIQGDVGSGKTAVAAALCHSVAANQMQSALMAPTEILAQQHFQTLSNLLKPIGIKVAILTGSMTASQRKPVLKGLKEGQISIVVGTHALFSQNVEFKRLALVITDEQHRFGVAQRAALMQKGNHPHLLVMSATPIPRTLALMIYGDLDISVLNELPPGRQKIETYAITGNLRPRAFAFIRKYLDNGFQAYCICPLIEENESDKKSVLKYKQELEQKYFHGYQIGVLHGKMKSSEKESIMQSFASGNLQLLVSTTVVEVGVNVPNAVIMLIENAEQYGLSQLHQLRGRVGRGNEKSTCILVSDAQNQEARLRLKIMCQTSDGFRIAEEDLRMRGPGDFFGSRQHGLPQLKIANMAQDIALLKLAQEDARNILNLDSSLSMPEHRGLRGETKQLFNKNGEIPFN